jgi:hypothetical protein
MPNRGQRAVLALFLGLSSFLLLPGVVLSEVCEPGFTPGPQFEVGVNAGTSALADLDGDSDLDLTTGGAVLFGNSDGTFSEPFPFWSVPTPWPYFDIVPGDFDGDELLDLALATMEPGGSVSLVYGRTGAVPPELPFGAPVPYPSAVVPWHMASADFNGDGLPDIVGVSLFPPPPELGGGLALFLNRGGRAFDARSIGPEGMPGHLLATSDFDGDGAVDVAFGMDIDLSVIFGNGDGTFGEARQTYLRATEGLVAAHRIRSADLDRDGRADLVAAAESWVLVYLGRDIDPSAELPRQASFAMPLAGTGRFLEIEDLNGDGFLDIAAQAAAETAVLQVYYGKKPEGDAALAFVTGSLIVTDLHSTRSVLAVGDVNGDGAPDMVLTTEGFEGDPSCLGQVFLNDGNCRLPSTAGAGDANADGDLDISDPVAILIHLFHGAALACPGAAEVNGDGDLDVSDPVFLLGYLFLRGAPPADPAVRACR